MVAALWHILDHPDADKILCRINPERGPHHSSPTHLTVGTQETRYSARGTVQLTANEQLNP